MRKLLLPFFLLATLSLEAQTYILAPMPGQTSTFSTNARGYWFVAPSCFTITGVEVPTTASSGNQSIAVVRFYATPPVYSITTNAFTTLFLTQNNPAAGMIPVNIQVEQGDIIGIMGVRNNINSYSNTGNVTTIEGFSVPLTRLGMQFPLATTAPTQLWQEPTSTNISRTFFYYDSVLTYNLSYMDMGGGLVNFDNDADSSFTSVWDYGDGSPLDTAWNPSHTYTTSGTYNVCTYITTTCGTDTLCTTVTVCGILTADYALAGSYGLEATFSNTSSGATFTYLWDFGDGTTDTTANPVHVFPSGGSYTVCLIASSVACGNDTICDTITVCDLPASGYTYTSIPGGAVDFTNSSMFGTSYLWDFGDGTTDTTTNPSHTYLLNGTYVVCLIASSSCGNDTICDTIMACPFLASASYSYFPSGGGTIMFADSSDNTTNWYWDFGDGDTSTTASPTHTFISNGIYYVCLISSNECSADTICDSIAVCPDAPASIFSQVSTGLTATFTNLSASSVSYLWDFGDGSTSTTTAPSHTYAAEGTYYVCLTAWNLCGDSSVTCDSVMIDIVGNVSPAGGANLTLAPNPATDEATLFVTGTSVSRTYTVQFTDIRGALVSIAEGRFNEALTVDTRNLPSGIYFFRITSGGIHVGQGKLAVTH